MKVPKNLMVSDNTKSFTELKNQSYSSKLSEKAQRLEQSRGTNKNKQELNMKSCKVLTMIYCKLSTFFSGRFNKF